MVWQGLYHYSRGFCTHLRQLKRSTCAVVKKLALRPNISRDITILRCLLRLRTHQCENERKYLRPHQHFRFVFTCPHLFIRKQILFNTFSSIVHTRKRPKTLMEMTVFGVLFGTVFKTSVLTVHTRNGTFSKRSTFETVSENLHFHQRFRAFECGL